MVCGGTRDNRKRFYKVKSIYFNINRNEEGVPANCVLCTKHMPVLSCVLFVVRMEGCEGTAVAQTFFRSKASWFASASVCSETNQLQILIWV